MSRSHYSKCAMQVVGGAAWDLSLRLHAKRASELRDIGAFGRLICLRPPVWYSLREEQA